MLPLTIALLGAECTGKSHLAQALAERLRQVPELAHGVALVPEGLRTWCERAGRAPQVHEQAALAQAQTEAIAQAQEQAGTRIVLADTTALTIAIYSEHYFQDTSLNEQALAQQGLFDLTLLMGLDLPWQPDGWQRDSPKTRASVDGLLRHRLSQAGLPFKVVCGRGSTRTDNALRALADLPGLATLTPSDPRPPDHRPLSCETCGDPDCEHRLFTGLLTTAPPTPT